MQDDLFFQLYTAHKKAMRSAEHTQLDNSRKVVILSTRTFDDLVAATRKVLIYQLMDGEEETTVVQETPRYQRPSPPASNSTVAGSDGGVGANQLP